MSDLKATPGPWFYDEQTDSVVTATEVEDGGDIVCLAPDMDASAARWPANREMIAAAPELYEALDELQRMASDIPSVTSNPRFAELRMAALRALAKARGQS